MSKQSSIKSLTIFSLTLFSLFFFSCNEQPTSISSPFTNDTLVLHPLSSEEFPIFAGTKGNIGYDIPGFNRGCMFVGKGNGLEAVSMVWFDFTNIVKNQSYAGIELDDIQNVYFTITPNRYSFGDSLSDQAFDIRELNDSVSVDYNWDDIFDANLGSTLMRDETAGQFRTNIELRDSMGTILIPLEKSIVHRWFQGDMSKDSSVGFFFVPTDGSKTISKLDGNKSEVKTWITIELRNAEEDIDTLKIGAAFDSYFVNGPDITENDKIEIQGGLSYRSELSFDLSMIPELNSFIHLAQLELTLDLENSLLGNLVADSTILMSNIEAVQDSNNTNLKIVVGITDTNYKYIFPRVSDLAESWVRTNGGQGKLNLFYSRFGSEIEESRFLDRLVFHGLNDPDPKKRPKLKIIYSTLEEKE